MEVLNRIIDILESQDKTQKDLTDYLGMQNSVFTKWKAGTNTSYLKHISKIAEFLDVSSDYLLGKTDQKEKPLSRADKGITDDDIKFALFSGSDHITDEMYEEVKQFAEFVKQKYKK